MKYLFILSLLIFPSFGFTQNPNEQVLQDTSELLFGNRKESLPIHISGSNDTLVSALYNCLTYPQEKCIAGTTVLTFKIDTSGNVKDPKILRSIDIQIDKQLLKEIINHTFIPGELYDKKVETTMHIPIRIHLK